MPRAAKNSPQVKKLPPPQSIIPDMSPVLHVSERERRFAVAYVEASVDLARDGVDAATLAYFRAFPRAVVSEDKAAQLARFLTRRPAVKELVNHLRLELSSRAMVPAARIVEELERMGLTNMYDFGRVDKNGHFQFDLSRTSYKQMSAVTELEVKERIVKVTPVKNDDGEIEEYETVLERKTKLKTHKGDALKLLTAIHSLIQPENQNPSVSEEALDREIARREAQLTIDQEGRTV